MVVGLVAGPRAAVVEWVAAAGVVIGQGVGAWVLADWKLVERVVGVA